MNCGTCKHWTPYQAGDSATGFGTCGKAEMHDSWEHGPGRPQSDIADKWLMCVIDGSGYFAALKTKESFGCILHETKSE